MHSDMFITSEYACQETGLHTQQTEKERTQFQCNSKQL